MVSAAQSVTTPSQTWVTWQGREPDRGATAWYIRRFVDRAAVFRELPQGTLDLGVGAPFDVPQSAFRRSAQWTGFELLLAKYPSNDPTIRRLALIVHDIEINLWQPKGYTESVVIEAAARALSAKFPDYNIPIACFIPWFDAIYTELKTRNTLSEPPRVPAECQVSK